MQKRTHYSNSRDRYVDFGYIGEGAAFLVARTEFSETEDEGVGPSS